jgi:hypothetical protein
LAILVGLALLLGGSYLLYGWVTHTFTALPSELKPLVTIGSIVALLCAAVVANGLQANAQREFRTRVVDEKLSLYRCLLAFCCEGLRSGGTVELHAADAERVEMETSLALAGSNKVVSAYVEFRRRLTGAQKSADTTALLAALVTEMRADLGRADLIRKQGDLLELLLGAEHGAGSSDRPSA